MISEKYLEDKYRLLSELLNERSLRLCAAADAQAIGYGGISRVARASGLSRTTVHAGIGELERAVGSSDEGAALCRETGSKRMKNPRAGRGEEASFGEGQHVA